jgi:hypothetical protein
MVSTAFYLAVEPWPSVACLLAAHLPPKIGKEKVPHEATPSVIYVLVISYCWRY